MKWMYPLALLLCLSVLTSYGQFSLHVDLGGGLTAPGGINAGGWTITISGPGDRELPAFLTLQLFDARQAVVYELKSHVFSLRGPRSISGRELNFAETEFVAPHLRQRLAFQSCLPRGNYTLLVQLVPNTAQAAPLAVRRIPWRQQQDCTLVLHLLTPPNRSNLANLRPHFSWTPADPGSVQYELSIYEMRTGQSPEQAVSNNPVWFRHRAAQTQHLFAPLGQHLQADQWYAWYVVAQQQDQVTARSDVWSFRYRPGSEEQTEEMDAPPRRPIYLKPGTAARPPTYRVDGHALHFFCVQSSAAESFELEIIDEHTNRIHRRLLDTKPGYNYLSFPFESIGIPKAVAGQQYRIDLLRNQRPDQSFFIHLQTK